MKSLIRLDKTKETIGLYESKAKHYPNKKRMKTYSELEEWAKKNDLNQYKKVSHYHQHSPLVQRII